MKPSVQENLESILYPDEHVIWQSETKPFGILDGKEGKKVLWHCIVSTVVAAVFAVLTALYGNATVTVCSFLALIYVVVMVTPIRTYRTLQAQEYVITDKRAITVMPRVGAYAIERANITDCALYPLSHSGEALAIGATLRSEGDKQLRWRARNAKLDRFAKSEDGLTYADGLVFYNVNNGSEALNILKASA